MDIVRTVGAARDAVADLKSSGAPVALICAFEPLHAGQASLVRLALGHGCHVVLALPAPRFDPSLGLEDQRPRPAKADLARAAEAGAQVVFAPPAHVLEPTDTATRIVVERHRDVLCGTIDPGRFDRQVESFAKLSAILTPDRLYIGQKSWQLLLITRQMVRDLHLQLEVMSGPTARAGDGVPYGARAGAMDRDARALAPQLFVELSRAAERIAEGEPTELACVEATENLIIAGIQRVEYFECRDARSLRLARAPGAGARVFGSVRLGQARLIDNVAVPNRGLV